MKFLVRWAFRLFILLLVLAVALVLLKDILFKALVESQLRTRTGMDARIANLELHLFSPTVRVEGLKVYNPGDFGGSPFLDIPDLHLQYDGRGLLRGQLHLPLVRVSLAEINIVEARDGRTNALLALDPGATPAPSPSEPWSALGFRFVGIDTLNLSVDHVKYSSLKKPGKPTELKVALKNEVFSNVKSLAELAHLVLRTTLRNGITISMDPPTDPPRAGLDPAKAAPAKRTKARP